MRHEGSSYRPEIHRGAALAIHAPEFIMSEDIDETVAPKGCANGWNEENC